MRLPLVLLLSKNITAARSWFLEGQRGKKAPCCRKIFFGILSRLPMWSLKSSLLYFPVGI